MYGRNSHSINLRTFSAGSGRSKPHESSLKRSLRRMQCCIDVRCMYSYVINYHFPSEDATAASQKSSTVMPRFRHSMCVYWTAASLIVFILTSRMFIEQRAVDRLHSTPTSLFPVHGEKETKRPDEYSGLSI
jgi:hypothetical protein